MKFYLETLLIDGRSKPFNMNCDISINNPLGVANSKLIRLYCEYDERCYLMMVYIRYLLKQAGVSDAAFGYLSSYAINLMVIGRLHF